MRLFFALPCPTEIAERIAAWRDGCHFAGRPVPAANFHLTLAFLGHLPESRLELLRQLPPRLPLAKLAFDLRLDRLDCWQGGLLHLAPGQTPEQLLALASGLDDLLNEAGLPTERRAYRPHLTLARDSRLAERQAPPTFAWRVEEMVLYQSEQGRYIPLSRWPLG
ncbi:MULTISPECIES: RNA 2',3'-cyclic phosphodiesterase [unclassified Pseudomonas]|uniref:RNA 2',3'-cyclic phosphodiesterase n=1 Tax=unclassified Pseudomonas TaxID=196821 RepID=UPI00244A079C|nr:MULTISPECIES: RNA 2',3'-cyclic phosphodiesterase [unclassified Pseudomonas]MDG9927062.1 RNA 2',3'-cyclic phosphodiesterase [Pseudomonas sp. GD04042]MDH0482929.1 RNA 2',3'-cyclic phosphodiesterase [Pseudomonas sp. GD04015]MDH0602477.1 RNA 2',3'-cyclic phosphodiesterase [Pseudomonas sp. GD03869]